MFKKIGGKIGAGTIGGLIVNVFVAAILAISSAKPGIFLAVYVLISVVAFFLALYQYAENKQGEKKALIRAE
ncbi:MAG TPA: hypothetical protein VMC41_00830 [Candidatus Nanoarchaeia archaeon]|nr:hypothetical protein [Candidatus Nanoarchaeia archaeon]